MRKLLAVLVLFLFLSCQFGYVPDLFPKEDQFEDAVKLEKRSEDGVYRFLVLTDAHFDRESEDDGVHHYLDSFNDFYTSYGKVIDAVFLLGDMMDRTDEASKEKFISFVRSSLKSKDIPIIYTIGNHETEHNSYEEWEVIFTEEEKELFSSFSRMARYSIGNVSIYKLDSALRTFGPYQLGQVEKHLKSDDDGKYRIYLSHIPLASDSLDMSLFQFTFASQEERARMLRLMGKWGKSWSFAGHHHIGNIATVFSDESKAFTFSSFHRRDSSLESKGYWYIVELGEEDGKLNIFPYFAETGEALDNVEL